MPTRVLKPNSDQDGREAVREAAACLAAGGLVVFPTETVYGVGASATDSAALRRLREVKQRHEEKPFTVHIGSRAEVARFVPNLHGPARRLIEKAWPGPLTVIFQVDDPSAAPIIRETSAEHIPAMYHDATIGMRCPDHPIGASVLAQAGGPVVAASANVAGNAAPISAEEALAELDGLVDIVIDTGRTRYAKASTIVRVSGSEYEIVREGVLDERTIRRLGRTNFLLVCSGNTCRSPMAAGILRHLLADRLGYREEELAEKGYSVESAGVSAYPGSLPSPAAVQALRRRGIDISSHRSQPVTPELAHRADYIFAMTEAHLDALASLGPSIRDRALPVDEGDIQDPIGENESVYAQCADRLEKALRRRLEEIPL